MNLNDFWYNYEGTQNQRNKLKRFFEYVIDNEDDYRELIDYWMAEATSYEADDYFGTEGYRV